MGDKREKEGGRESVPSLLFPFLYIVSPMVTSVYPDPSQMNYTVNMTDTVRFECVATGIPAPSITWFRSGEELNSTTDPRVTFDDPSTPVSVGDGDGEMIYEVTHAVSISMSADEDSGMYECRASNDATPGNDTMEFELIVQSE